MTDRPIDRLLASANNPSDWTGTYVGRPLMLQFQFAEGKILALAYSHLYRVELHQRETIELQFTSHAVVVFGDSLSPLFDELIQMQTTRIEESDPLTCVNDGPSVKAITVRILSETNT